MEIEAKTEEPLFYDLHMTLSQEHQISMFPLFSHVTGA